MGCVSSSLLENEDEFTQLGGSGLSHHIVSLTSTTYGLLTIDPPHINQNPPTPPRFGIVSLFPSPLPEPRTIRSEPETINSWELMADLDCESSRFSPTPPPKHSFSLLKTVSELDSLISKPPKVFNNKENLNPSRLSTTSKIPKYSLEEFEKRCPVNGEEKVVLYTTTLRGVRKTFEDCNAVRAALEGTGVLVSERDVSMHRGFIQELKDLIFMGREKDCLGGGAGFSLPKVFIKGRYIGGAEEVLKIHEEGCLGALVQGLPKARIGVVCDGCGGVRFLPCFQCYGSCKIVLELKDGRRVVIRCADCNENGLVLCPICS
ncbi:hypothetical protein GIB67_041242 [Kingdonia uniflora]|uniref:Glutaredoxin domain-containing protein n=1 Tax=Kingdonia uniflora TaxID=39325 RepID=A0A7J7LMG3_9MAGN|nr:hypothetical protein GIB67_041242 [Kingdonia uniflora]